MTRIITRGMPLIAALSVTVAARADCTSQPFRLGMDAAEQACSDIVDGYYPGPAFVAPVLRGESTPERVCTLEDEVDCKNAMAQYTREHPECRRLIRRDIQLYDLATGEPRGRAEQTWRTYMVRTCSR